MHTPASLPLMMVSVQLPQCPVLIGYNRFIGTSRYSKMLGPDNIMVCVCTSQSAIVGSNNEKVNFFLPSLLPSNVLPVQVMTMLYQL